MDAQVHVNNAIFLDYLQEARVEFLLTGPPAMADLLTRGVLVVSHQVEFLAPVDYESREVIIELWVDLLQGARFRIAYDVLVGDTIAARARTVAVPFDLEEGRLRRLHPAERDFLQTYLRDTEDLRPTAQVDWDTVRQGASYPLRLRWSDLDSYGHANNVKVFDYFQEGRIAVMDRHPGDFWLLVRQDATYVRPLDFRREPYEVRSVVTAIGTSSTTLGVEIRDPETGTVFAHGISVLVYADTTGRPRPLPDRARRDLASWAVTGVEGMSPNP